MPHPSMHWPVPENKRISELEQTIKTINKDNESLKAIMQILQQDFNEAHLNLDKQNSENQCLWHVIKPKEKISSENKLDKNELECKT